MTIEYRNEVKKEYSFSRVHFSSLTGEWSTPRSLFDQLDAEFHFTIDLCANPDNAKCEKFFTPEDNALFQKWSGVCWLNPPYGREVGRWLGKAVDAARNGATVVCLMPARTDTKWFHRYCQLTADIRFVKGRIYFTAEGKVGKAPFPSMIIVFSPDSLGLLNLSPMERGSRTGMLISWWRRLIVGVMRMRLVWVVVFELFASKKML